MGLLDMHISEEYRSRIMSRIAAEASAGPSLEPGLWDDAYYDTGERKTEWNPHTTGRRRK